MSITDLSLIQEQNRIDPKPQANTGEISHLSELAANSQGDGLRIAASGTNLDLMMDVELNVLLRFGQRQLTLREVLGLKCGSVIELDRRVDEPVELLIDGRVIARGEAAIVDGNYGLRVTEIVRSRA